MIVDAHNHVAPWPTVTMTSKEKVTFSAEELLSVMNEGRVDKAVIFGAGPYLFPQFNKMIAETVNKYPDRLIGFARVDPYEGEKAVDELAHAVKDLGMKGLKLHPSFQGFRIDSPVVHPVLEEVRKMDIPVLLHSGVPAYYAHPSQVEDLARNFPDVTIIVGHMGEVDYTIDAVKAAKKCDNVMLETSWTSKTGIEYAAQEIGADRIIMGSDVPYGHPAIELKKIELLKIPEEEKDLIRGMNLARILRLK